MSPTNDHSQTEYGATADQKLDRPGAVEVEHPPVLSAPGAGALPERVQFRPGVVGLLAAGVVFAVSVLLGLYLHLQYQTLLKEELQQGLIHLASAAAPLVDVAAHETLTDVKQDMSESYNRQLVPLRRFAESVPEVKFVYTFRRVDGVFYFVLDPTPDGDADHDGQNDRASLMMRYDESTPRMQEVIETGRALAESEPVRDAWGEFLSGYAPLRDPQGQVVGLIGVDLDIADYRKRLEGTRQAAWGGLLLAAALSLAVGAGAYGVRRRALAEVRRRKEAEAAVHAAHAATAAANENLARVNHELRASTAEAMRLRREAEARSHAKSEFMAVMSHEIRTPLNGVIGMAELLSASGLADKQREIADALCASGRILLGVINDVLDFSKIESGLFTIGSQPLDVRDVVDSAMEVTAHRLRGAAISAAAIVNRAVPTMVMGDANRLRQVLANLLSNAFKFTTQGEVLLRVDRVVSADGAASLRFSVEDTGPGMAPAELERLFQPYQQGESGQLQQSDGSGLGLTISSRLVGLMGGELRVTSEKGTGSRFWFELQEEPVESGALEAHILASAPKVIVISPHGPTRESLEEHVASLGGRVEGVATIAEGAAIAAGLPAHFVVDAACGPDAAVICPASLRAPGQRAVWITTWRDALNRSTVEGYDDILIKPTKRSVLRQTLTRLGSFEVASDTARVASNEQDPDTPGLDLKQQLAGKRVLVVEDNCINRRLCQLQLERLGAVVELAVDGAEGVARFLEKPFDLVITDCQMPVMDGFEAARAMREAEAKNVETFGARRARIIALTANALAGERERCFASGMDGFLVKPFTREQLRQALLEGQSA